MINQLITKLIFLVCFSVDPVSAPVPSLQWSPLELFSVCERLKTPCPPQNTDEKKYDFTNVVDVCCKLRKLQLTGSTEKIGTSQIVPNLLKIDFLAFKSLTELHLVQLTISPASITSLGILRNTLQILRANQCSLTTVSQLMLCDVIHTEEELPTIMTSSSYQWPQLLQLDIR